MNKKFQNLPLAIPLAAATVGTVLSLYVGRGRLHTICGAALVALSAAHGVQHFAKMKHDAKKFFCTKGQKEGAQEGTFIPLKSFLDRLEVRSFTAGRVRVANPLLIGNEALAAQLESYVKSFQGVREAKANPVTGSLLIVYVPEEVRRVPGLKKLEARFLS